MISLTRCCFIVVLSACDAHKESDGCKNNACMAGPPDVSCNDPFSAIYKSCKEDKTRTVCTSSSWTNMCQAVGYKIKEVITCAHHSMIHSPKP